jgi:hypothetical protein
MSQSNPEFVRESGASLLSRNALDRKAPIRWAFREPPANPADNGWVFLSAIDDDTFLSDPANMAVVGFNTVVLIEPAILPLLHLPEGTDATIERDTDGRITIIDNDSGEPIVF